MLKNELRLRERAYRNGWIKQSKLAKCWRAIARRHLSRLRDAEREADMWYYSRFAINDGETDP
jgi:hypothetical protein